MKEKNKILVLINQSRLRLGLWREFEAEAEMYHAERFQDIIAEIKWQELDAIVIDMSDPEIDGMGIIQTINSTCPSASVLLISEENDNTLDQILGLLANASIVTGKINAKMLAEKLRYEMTRTKRAKSRRLTVPEVIPMQIDEAFGKAIEQLIVALMGVNHQAANFQLNRDNITWNSIQRIEHFAGELLQVTRKYADEEAGSTQEDTEEKVGNQIC